MSLSVSSSTALELAKAQREAALAAKEAAEAAKLEAEEKEAAAAAAAEQELLEADEAEAAVQKEEEDVVAAQEKVNSAAVRVNTAQAAYTNACSQLTQAQNALTAARASGDETAIANAEAAVDKAKTAADNAYKELQAAQQEAEEAYTLLAEETAEYEAAATVAAAERAEAEQAQLAADEAAEELNTAEANLKTAEADLEEADTVLAEAEEAATAEDAEESEDVSTAAKASATTGVAEAEHLSDEEIEELVDEGYTYITSQEQFLEIFQGGEIDLDGKYILGCNIDLSDVENWQSVGNSDSPFTGVFNGNGYSISNLTITVTDSDAENVGFFGVTENAEITNVSFVNANVVTPDDYINGSSSVGIVAGTARGTTFDNINISGSVTGYESIGGLAGVINDNSYYNQDGELVTVGNSSISNVETAIDATGKYYVGGLIGYVEDTSTGEGVATRSMMISDCNTSGTVTFDDESAGGFIGQAGKTVITINNCESAVDIIWTNSEDDSDISALMETGRAGGFIGCADGTYIAMCNSEYSGNLDADGDFKGEWYGWYMNDSHVTIYELSEGLPVDDILNIDGIDSLTPITDSTTGITSYEVTVSTLTGLDKMVAMIQANPELAEIITFNVNFDFETMNGTYDVSVYEQYGVVQHLYEDEDGNVCNDVYIDNEIDLETTFRYTNTCNKNFDECNKEENVTATMVKGLYIDSDGNYVVSTSGEYTAVNLNFNTDGQVTTVTKRLESDEVRYREYITTMVQYYQNKMYAALKALFGYDEDYSVDTINKAEYKKLQAIAEAGGELTDDQKLAMAIYEVDYTVMNMVSETTNNYGCGMGGDASFLEATTAIQMYNEDGRALYTTLNGDVLLQKLDDDGNLVTDDDGNPVYEYEDGTEYEGLAEVFAQKGYPATDDDGNFLYTDADGNTVTRIVDEDGNIKYQNADGSDYEGSEDDLTQQLDPYDNASEYANLEEEMKSLLEDVENGAYPLGTTDDTTEAKTAAVEVEEEADDTAAVAADIEEEIDELEDKI